GCQVAVEDGLLTLKDGDGWLRSDRTYADFILHVEWKALKTSEYDSGVYIRTLRGGAPFPKASHQVNLLDGQERNINNIPGDESSGLVKRGEWNTFDITCRGDEVTLEINGKRAYCKSGLARPVGYVGLQSEVAKGGQFQFRNLRVTELGWKSMFNG